MVCSALLLMLTLGSCGTPDGLPVDRLPSSTAVLEVPVVEAVVVVDHQSIRVDGERVDTLDAAQREGLLYRAVFEALDTRAAEVRSAAAQDATAPTFQGELALELDRDLPGRLLLEMVYTAGQAGFATQWLVVADAAGQRRGIRLALPRISAASAAAPAAQEVAGSWANPRLELDPERGFVLYVHDLAVDPGTGLVLGCDPSPCTSTWPNVELNRVARRVKLDHPRDRAVMVLPADPVPVGVLVGAFDATRDDRVVARGERELFPEVQLALPEGT